jgi:hypothetical protein
MDREEMNPEEIRLEQSLRQLTARPSGVDRDRLMFLAGQQSVSGVPALRRSQWFWPAATASMSTVAACFAIAFIWQLSREPEVRIVVREVPVEKPAPAQVATVNPQPGSTASSTPKMTSTPVSLDLPATSVLQMRNFALRFGVEAIPAEPRSSTSSAMTLSPIDQWQQLRDAAPESDSPL